MATKKSPPLFMSGQLFALGDMDEKIKARVEKEIKASRPEGRAPRMPRPPPQCVGGAPALFPFPPRTSLVVASNVSRPPPSPKPFSPALWRIVHAHLVEPGACHAPVHLRRGHECPRRPVPDCALTFLFPGRIFGFPRPLGIREFLGSCSECCPSSHASRFRRFRRLFAFDRPGPVLVLTGRIGPFGAGESRRNGHRGDQAGTPRHPGRTQFCFEHLSSPVSPRPPCRPPCATSPWAIPSGSSPRPRS